MYLRTSLCPQMNRYRHHQTEMPSLPFDTCEKLPFLAPVLLSSPIRCVLGAAARRKFAQVDLGVYKYLEISTKLKESEQVLYIEWFGRHIST